MLLNRIGISFQSNASLHECFDKDVVLIACFDIRNTWQTEGCVLTQYSQHKAVRVHLWWPVSEEDSCALKLLTKSDYFNLCSAQLKKKKSYIICFSFLTEEQWKNAHCVIFCSFHRKNFTQYSLFPSKLQFLSLYVNHHNFYYWKKDLIAKRRNGLPALLQGLLAWETSIGTEQHLLSSDAKTAAGTHYRAGQSCPNNWMPGSQGTKGSEDCAIKKQGSSWEFGFLGLKEVLLATENIPIILLFW